MTSAENNTSGNPSMETATFGMGCFWCSEAVFQDLKGVYKVESGYEGGHTKNPSYKEVCTGTTGHAEVIQVTYNPKEISYETLLEIFWKLHDPTTLNRQGADVGTQYRSVIFYHTPEQKAVAENFMQELNRQQVFPNPIVTQIAPAATFYKAENYHQDYYKLHGQEPYCQYVIKPKMEKLEKVFKEKLKAD
ncbi:peptide-methionine (S)-S-oxide reductase MsrA [Adhaeribacter soli]|nr:peptide-methionine (S)-S-oxide reductase MsrA [Adhaeribacter soli]